MVARAPGNYDADLASFESGLGDTGKSLTVQSEAADADINVIVKRFGITGELPVVQRTPLLVDIDDVLDYRMCVDRVRNAEKAFLDQPAHIRDRFGNDPRAFVEFFSDDANRAEALRLGVLKEPAQAAPAASPPAPAVPASGT